MKWLVRTLIILWFIALAALGAWLMTDNSEQVAVVFFGLSLPAASLGLVLALTLLAGLMLGLLTSMLTVEPRLLLTKRELARAKKELGKLRVSDLKE